MLAMMDVMMAILPSPRLLLHQVLLSLRRPLRRPYLLQLQLHLRQSPQAVLSSKAMTFRLRLRHHHRLRHLRLRLLLRLSLLLRLPPPKPAAVAVAMAVAVMCIREECTYLGICSFYFAHCFPRGTFFYQNGVAGACGTVHQDSDLICAMGECLLARPTQKNLLSLS